MWDVSKCLIVRVRRGRHKLVGEAAFRAHKSIRDKAARTPAPPRIQAFLRQAHEIKARLAADPGLTRTVAAREAGVDPCQLTRVLRLASLAPEIQRHIRALPPSIGRIVITERRLRPIAKLPSHRDQLARFQELLQAPVRVRKAPHAAIQVPSVPAAASVASLGHLGA